MPTQSLEYNCCQIVDGCRTVAYAVNRNHPLLETCPPLDDEGHIAGACCCPEPVAFSDDPPVAPASPVTVYASDVAPLSTQQANIAPSPQSWCGTLIPEVDGWEQSLGAPDGVGWPIPTGFPPGCGPPIDLFLGVQWKLDPTVDCAPGLIDGTITAHFAAGTGSPAAFFFTVYANGAVWASFPTVPAAGSVVVNGGFPIPAAIMEAPDFAILAVWDPTDSVDIDAIQLDVTHDGVCTQPNCVRPTYTEPQLDPAPWWDWRDTRSEHFLGALLLESTWMESLPYEREVDDLRVGSTARAPRLPGKELTMRLLLLIDDCCARDFAIEWVRDRLIKACDRTGGCGLPGLQWQECCNDEIPEADGARFVPRVAVTGYSVPDNSEVPECCGVEVEVTFRSELPWTYEGCGRTVLEVPLNTGDSVCQLCDDCPDPSPADCGSPCVPDVNLSARHRSMRAVSVCRGNCSSSASRSTTRERSGKAPLILRCSPVPVSCGTCRSWRGLTRPGTGLTIRRGSALSRASTSKSVTCPRVARCRCWGRNGRCCWIAAARSAMPAPDPRVSVGGRWCGLTTGATAFGFVCVRTRRSLPMTRPSKSLTGSGDDLDRSERVGVSCVFSHVHGRGPV